MNQHIKELISGYLDCVLTEDQQAELAAWIESDSANADQFAEAVFLDNRVHAEVNAAPFMNPGDTGNPSDSVQPITEQRRNQKSWHRIIAALAACLLVAIGIGYWLSQNDDQQLAKDRRDSSAKSTFASIAQIVDAQWDSGTKLSIGDRLSSQTIRFRSGFLRLEFDDGVEVTLQGPVEYELLATGKTRLTSGLLTATVPPGAEGFTIDTPTAKIVDLGTAFGIDLQEEGISHVSVFEGEVEVSLSNTTETRLLKEGEAVRIADGKSIEIVDFDPEPFTKVWPVSSGIERSTDEFRFVPPWPPQQRFVRSDTDIFIVPEGHVQALLSSLSVNVSNPGTYSREEDLSVSKLEEGQRIRSFMLFFHPEKAGRRQPAKQVNGSITFDSPVLGLIVRHKELQASARRFARHGPRSIRENQQLELTGDANSDVVTLSDDRRTVTLKLTTSARTAELMRVIVDASPQNLKTPESANNAN